MGKNISAIIWDYDGTLVDTREKNLNVLREVVAEVMDQEYTKYKCLLSVEKHQIADYNSKNWREMYFREFGMNEEQVNYAGSLWGKYQLSNITQCKLFCNLTDIIKQLRIYPMGIVSQNSSENIEKQLIHYGLSNYFSKIIGYEEVESCKQKPAPNGLMDCISHLEADGADGSIIYIGDHETDIVSAYNANKIYNKKKIYTIAALYEKQNETDAWSCKPDYIANYPGDIIKIADRVESLFKNQNSGILVGKGGICPTANLHN